MLRLAIVAPCFNEGQVAARFVQEVDTILAGLPVEATLIVVDDASTDDTVDQLLELRPSFTHLELRIISLNFNMGHQEAIYQGLLFASTLDHDRFVVMDSDGEDDPAAIKEMIADPRPGITLVARGRRSESLKFKVGYFLYRRLFRLVTKRSISFGNYSMIDRKVLGVVIDKGFTHYAAFLSRQRAATRLITYDRRPRIDGRSKMSFKSLSIHAFRSLIEYSEDVLSLFLKGFFLLALLAIAAITFIVGVKLFTDEAIPGWASIVAVSLLNSTLLCLGFFAIGLLLVNTMHRRIVPENHFSATINMALEQPLYIGQELDLFSHAQNWKRYFASHLKPYVRGRVLDVGCGMGVNADHLWNDQVSEWTFLEPDHRLLDQVPAHVNHPSLRSARRINGTTSDLQGMTFDTILYMDVIEHIEDSKAELQRAAQLLAPGGHLIVLVPAFNFLFTPFDKAIGHFRRYDKPMLKADLPEGLKRVELNYLDSLAFFLSLANKWFLRQSTPRLQQVLFWDRWVVPTSRITDKLFFHTFGKSLIAVARKD